MPNHIAPNQHSAIPPLPGPIPPLPGQGTLAPSRPEPSPQRAPNPRPQLPRSYLAVWGLLATFATSYLALVLTAPGTIGLPAHGATSSLDMAATNNSRSVRGLQDRLSRAQLEIAKLRTRISQQEDAYAQMKPTNETRPTAEPTQTASTTGGAVILNRPSATTNLAQPSAPNELAIAKAQISNPAGLAATKPSPIVTGSIKIPPPPTRAPPPPLNATRVISAPLFIPSSSATATNMAATATNVAATATSLAATAIQKPEPTTPVATAPASQFPAQVTATAAPEQSMGVRLASGPSIDALRLRWNMMLDRAGPTMNGLEPRFAPSRRPGTLGPSYDLIAGPLKTLSDAQRICNAAAVRSSVCEIRNLQGSREL